MRDTPASKSKTKHRSSDTERTLPEPNKSLATWFIAENESVRLTNGLIALTTRVLTSGVRGMALLYQRNRSRW